MLTHPSTSPTLAEGVCFHWPDVVTFLALILARNGVGVDSFRHAVSRWVHGRASRSVDDPLGRLGKGMPGGHSEVPERGLGKWSPQTLDPRQNREALDDVSLWVAIAAKLEAVNDGLRQSVELCHDVCKW